MQTAPALGRSRGQARQGPRGLNGVKPVEPPARAAAYSERPVAAPSKPATTPRQRDRRNRKPQGGQRRTERPVPPTCALNRVSAPLFFRIRDTHLRASPKGTTVRPISVWRKATGILHERRRRCIQRTTADIHSVLRLSSTRTGIFFEGAAIFISPRLRHGKVSLAPIGLLCGLLLWPQMVAAQSTSPFAKFSGN